MVSPGIQGRNTRSTGRSPPIPLKKSFSPETHRLSGRETSNNQWVTTSQSIQNRPAPTENDFFKGIGHEESFAKPNWRGGV
jgi:hypothetical protein